MTPLEDMYVDIVSRGSKRAGVLSSGDVLPVSRTVSPVEISSVLDVFDTNTRRAWQPCSTSSAQGCRATAVLSCGRASRRSRRSSVSPAGSQQRWLTSAATWPRSCTTSGASARSSTSATINCRVRHHADSTLGELAQTSGPFGATIQHLPGTLAGDVEFVLRSSGLPRARSIRRCARSDRSRRRCRPGSTR